MKLYTLLLLLLTTHLTIAQTVIEPTLVWDPLPDTSYKFLRIHGGGDLNGDGYDDIVLKYSGYKDSLFNYIPGNVKVYYGGETIDTIADVVLPTMKDENSVYFKSKSIAYNGDLNNDGFSDLVIGCTYNPSESNEGEGAILIYLGRENLKTEPDYILKGRDYGTDTFDLEFGSYVDLRGDLNGDGYNDLVTSTDGPSYFWNGQVDIFNGGETFDTEVDWHKKGEVQQFFGGTDFSIGDVNGDGFDDLIVPRGDENNMEGDDILEIYAGGTQMDTLPDYSCVIDGYQPQYADCGDFNGDGCADYVNGEGILAGDPEFNLEFIEYEMQSKIYHLSFTDTNLDGLKDICVAYSKLHKVSFYPGNTLFNFSESYFFDAHEPNGIGSTTIFLGNITGNGGSEFLVNCGYMGVTHFELYSFDSIIDPNEITFQKSKKHKLCSYPNPFNSSTIISFNLQESMQNGEMVVYNLSGQLVSTLYTGNLSKGNHSFTWQAHNQAAGVYLVKLKSGNKVTTKKLLYVK